MIWSSLAVFVALAEALPQGGGAGASTMLRFGCSQIIIDRIDPLVNPGIAPVSIGNRLPFETRSNWEPVTSSPPNCWRKRLQYFHG